MKKFIKYIFGIILFMGFTNIVNAKEILMNCDYYAPAGDSLSSILTNEVSVSCEIYDDYSHSCLVYNGSKKANRESIVNYNYHNSIKFSARDYIEANNKCPDNMYFVGEKGLNGYAIYLADNQDTINRISAFLQASYNPPTRTKVLDSTSRDYTDEEKEKCYSEIVNYADIMSSAKFDIDNCSDDSKVITRYSECKDQLVDSNTFYRKMKETGDQYIHTNCIDKNDSRTVAFLNALEKYKNGLDGFEKDLGTGDCEIKGELGIECNTDVSTWDKTNGETLKFAKKIYSMIKIVIPILIVILSIVDFLKVVLLSDEKNYSATWSKFIKRIIIGLVFFAVPAIISLILELSGLGESGILNVFV